PVRGARGGRRCLPGPAARGRERAPGGGGARRGAGGRPLRLGGRAGCRRRRAAPAPAGRPDFGARRNLRPRSDMELIHTCYRITDIDRSVAFYEALGFEERGRMPIREEAINVFMGLPGDGDRLELTYNFGVDSYEPGTGYGHIAVTVDD